MNYLGRERKLYYKVLDKAREIMLYIKIVVDKVTKQWLKGLTFISDSATTLAGWFGTKWFTFLGFRVSICKIEGLKYNHNKLGLWLLHVLAHRIFIITSWKRCSTFIFHILQIRKLELKLLVAAKVMTVASRLHSWNLNPKACAFPALKFYTSKNAIDEQNTSIGFVWTINSFPQ